MSLSSPGALQINTIKRGKKRERGEMDCYAISTSLTLLILAYKRYGEDVL